MIAFVASRDRIALSLGPAKYQALVKSGVLFRKNVAARDGLTTLRVLVGETGSPRIGSLIVPVPEIN